MRILVAGAGGFIGGHLVNKLVENGNSVIAVDIKPFQKWYQINTKATNIVRDMSILDHCELLTQNIDTVYNLAADMGGMGFIENNKAKCMLSVLINTNLIDAATYNKVSKYFFASSACVYNSSKQKNTDIEPLKESDAYPADPEDGYGWEKLFSERMCRHFMEDFGIKTYVARYHNVFGPNGTYSGGREKAPAAICRKVIEAKLSGKHTIEIWGDGEQTRSFMYIDDCIRGTIELSQSNFHQPINIGTSEIVTINQLVNIAEDIANIKLDKKYNLSAPQGVRGRNSDNTLFRSIFGWEPSISLMTGMKETYDWIFREMTK